MVYRCHGTWWEPEAVDLPAIAAGRMGTAVTLVANPDGSPRLAVSVPGFRCVYIAKRVEAPSPAWVLVANISAPAAFSRC